MQGNNRPQPAKISIVTPSYNQGQFIRATIESVMSQSYDDLEYIVVDGGSTDDSVATLQEYSDRLKWISEPDEGQSDAINKGWRMSTGDVVTWLNSDDLLATPQVIAQVAEAFRRHPDVDIIYGDYDVIGVHGEHLFRRKQAPFNPHVLLFSNNFIVPAAFFRRELLDSVGYLDVDLHWVMDLDYWLRALTAGARFKAIPIPMWKHRFHPDSNTVGGIREMEREVREIQRLHQPGWFRKPGALPRLVETVYAGALRVWTQFLKLTRRGHLDNLLYSYYIRRHYTPRGEP